MTTYHSRMMNIARQGAGRVDVFDFDSFESGHHHGHKAARHAAADIANEADAEIARLQAQVVDLAFLVQTAPTFFSAHSFDGEKLLWLKRAGLVPKDAK